MDLVRCDDVGSFPMCVKACIDEIYYIKIKPDDKIEDIKRTIQDVSGLFNKK
jgi:hypothetical protein